VAQYADVCNVGGDNNTVAHKYAVLREHCERMGRPYEAITRSNDVGILIAADDQELAAKKAQHGEDYDLVGTPEAIIEGLHRYAEVGSQYRTFHMPDAQEIAPIRLLGETVVPAVAGPVEVGSRKAERATDLLDAAFRAPRSAFGRGRALRPGGLGGSVARWSYPRGAASRTDRLFSARSGGGRLMAERIRWMNTPPGAQPPSPSGGFFLPARAAGLG
jgi:hypothetical protein